MSCRGFTFTHRWCFKEGNEIPLEGTKWRRARSENTAFRSAMKEARLRFPYATSKGYARVFKDGQDTVIDFGHYHVFVVIRPLGETA